MSSGMPELGSKISLISKADIRYEGRLYTVDPQECTIALSSVRSFGTEDRETQYQIAPQSQIYDYILFRGSDIKDIRVINNSLPHPNDPAIMQVQLQNGQHLMPHFSMPSMTAAQAANTVMGTGNSAYGGSFGPGTMNALGGITSTTATGPVPSLAPGGPAPYMLGNQQHSNQQQQQQLPKTLQGVQTQSQQQLTKQQQSMLAGASRSTTPISLISRKSPSNVEVGVNQHLQQQLHQQQQKTQNHQHNNHGQPHQQLVTQNHVTGDGSGATSGTVQLHKRQNHNQQQPQQRGSASQRGNNKHDYYHYQLQNQQHNMNNRRDRRDNNIIGRSGDYGSITTNGTNHIRNYNNRRGGNNMPNNRGRWNDGGFTWAKSGFKQMLIPRNSKNSIKFDQDFDFEQANNKFEELRLQLVKLKVGDEPKSSEQVNGETDKKDDSGNETGAGEHEHEEDEITVGYNKAKSFFDTISCETVQDRTKNKGHDWRQERKLNSETFGVSSTRRGGYRGNYYNNRNMMGGGYNVGGSGGGGGGYNRNYRNTNNYRNRSNNRNNNATTRDTVGRNASNNTDTHTGTTTTTTTINNIANNAKNPTQLQNQGVTLDNGGVDSNINGVASTSKSVTAGLTDKVIQSPIVASAAAAAGQ